MVTESWDLATEKWHPSKRFKQCVTLSTQEAGKAIFLKDGNAFRESMFSGLYLAGTVSLKACETCRPAPKAT